MTAPLVLPKGGVGPSAARGAGDPAVVVGAGAAGLAAALELEARGRPVVVLDAGDRPGGVMQSDRIEGCLVERGPNTIRVGAEALAVLRRADAEAALLRAAPASRKRFLLCDGQLVPVPLGPLALARTPLLSGAGKRRLLREPFVPRGDATRETVADFVGRRLGPEVLERLVGPFLVGVYAGDERELGAEAVFPSLVAMEREHGSIARGALAAALRRGPRGLPGTWSARGGLGALAERMAGALRTPPRLATRVAELTRERRGFRLTVEGPEGSQTLRASLVVVATDAPAAARLLAGLDADVARFAAAVDHAPLASVALSVEETASAHPMEGFGFLVPRGEGLDLLGALFTSRLFPGRAPPGRVLVTALIGGRRWPEVADAPDHDVLKRVVRGLDRALGIEHGIEPVAITRWERAVPQPGPAHGAGVRALRTRIGAIAGLGVAGGWLEGVGVSDTLASGARAAAELLDCA